MQRRQGKLTIRRKKEESITFFFRNFRETCSEGRLRRKFEEVGKVEDLFLPAKKDKCGNRFGFVRFVKDGEGSRLLEKLNHIWIDSYVIRAFIPRFERPKAVNGVERRRR